MKTSNNALTIARAVIFSMALFFAGMMNGQTYAKVSNTGGPKDKDAIHVDVNTINQQKVRVKELKSKLKSDCKAGNKEAAIIDRKDLRKAKADLKRDKVYLVADARDVTSDDNLAIRNCKKVLKKDEADLRSSRKTLAKARSRNDASTIRTETARVDLFENRVQDDKNALERERQKWNNDRAFVKKEVKRLDGDRKWFYLSNM